MFQDKRSRESERDKTRHGCELNNCGRKERRAITASSNGALGDSTVKSLGRKLDRLPLLIYKKHLIECEVNWTQEKLPAAWNSYLLLFFFPPPGFENVCILGNRNLFSFARTHLVWILWFVSSESDVYLEVMTDLCKCSVKYSLFLLVSLLYLFIPALKHKHTALYGMSQT